MVLFALASSCTRPKPIADPNLDELRADIAYLSAPEMAGREPGGEAQDAVTGFIIDRMEQAGLSPAFTAQTDAKYGGWAQPVALYQRVPLGSKIQFKLGNTVLSQPLDRFAAIGIEPEIEISKAPILFLGRGNVELTAKHDLSGAVVIAHAAPNESDRASREAVLAYAGAIGIIELARGGEAFAMLHREFDGHYFFQPSIAIDPISGGNRTKFSAVMGEERAVALATQSGTDWDKMLLRSSMPGYSGEWMKATMDLSLKTAITPVASHNIGGRLKGKKPGSGAVVFVAHWDHLGYCVRRSGLPDIICPGAVDNASGIAALLQIAETLAEKPHDRDIYFIATTGEEHGFVGAKTVLSKGPVAPSDLVALFNLDMLAIAPSGTPVAVIGWNDGPFDRAIAKVISEQNLVRAESPLADTFLRRQDGWVFWNAGLPARMVNSSYGDEWALKAFLANGYHSPSDRYGPTMELGGASQDIRLHIALGRHFADTRLYPAD